MTPPIPFPSPLRALRGTSATSVVRFSPFFSAFELSTLNSELSSPITPLFPPHRRPHPINIFLSMTSQSRGGGVPRLLLTKHPTRVLVPLAPAIAGSESAVADESKGLSKHPIRMFVLSDQREPKGLRSLDLTHNPCTPLHAPSESVGCRLATVGSPYLNYRSPIALAPPQCHNRAYDPSPGSSTGRKHFRSLRCLILRADKGWDFATPGKSSPAEASRFVFARNWGEGGRKADRVRLGQRPLLGQR